MNVAIPVTPDGSVGQTWGKAPVVAVAEVAAGRVIGWSEYAVGWDILHDAGTHGGHHARVIGFLREHDVAVVVADHVGPGMVRMLDSAGIRLVTGAGGDARAAAVAACGA